MCFCSDMESDGNDAFSPPPADNKAVSNLTEVSRSEQKDQPPPLPTSPLPDEEATSDPKDPEKPTGKNLSSGIVLPQAERLIGGSSSTIVTTRVEPKSDHEDLIPPLPSALEHHVRVLKDSDTLGVQVLQV